MKYILVLLVCVHLVSGQVLKPKQEALVRNTIASQFGWEIANSTILNLGRASFCVVGQDTLYNLAGYHYVFKLIGDSAVRLDKSKFHGIDHYRYIFSWNNKLFCLGGCGMFLSHNTLKFFNIKTGEWIFQPVTGNAPYAINGISLKKDSLVYTFNNFISGNNVTKDSILSGLYCLNLNSMLWEKYNVKEILSSDLEIDFKMQNYCLSDYVIQLCFNKLLITDINTLNIYNIPCEHINIKYGTNIIKVLGNTLITKTDTIEINSKKLKEFYIGNLNTKLEKTSKNNIFIIAIIIIIISLVIVLISLNYNKHKLLKVNNDAIVENTNSLSADPENEILTKLKQSSNLNLTIDELDTILGIYHLEPDSKRLRRHRMLNELNLKFPNLITRIKDSADKRKFLYRINFIN